MMSKRKFAELETGKTTHRLPPKKTKIASSHSYESQRSDLVIQATEPLELQALNHGLESLHENKERKKERKRLRDGLKSGWTVSGPVGGRLLDLDSIFSEDEQHLLIAFPDCIKVYATKTSVLIRALQTGKKGDIAAFALSVYDPSRVYVALCSGRIELWNWVEGQRVTAWDVKAEIFDLQVATLPDDKGRADDMLLLADRSKSKPTITAHRFQKQDSSKTSEVKTLLEAVDRIKQFRILRNGQVIIAACEKRLLIGIKRGKEITKSLESLRYVWRELEFSKSITALAGQVVEQISHDAEDNQALQCNIAVGTAEGVIFLYKDIISQLNQAENKHQRATPHANRLHWHRNAVGSLGWSKDGNYLISGGNETVLILWQLDTGKRQVLPHLSSAIESVVVSSSGLSYSIRLADNSVMVLSTLDLQPTANISGLQLPLQISKISKSEGDNMPTNPATTMSIMRNKPAVTILPNSSQLLFAVPATVSSRSRSKQSSSAPFLQIVDAKTCEQIARQAIARTKVTDRIIGPEGNVIEEPNVVLMRTSWTGEWLATIDEWVPPTKDNWYLALNKADGSREQRARLETNLKFWAWNKEATSWELVWKVESPHTPELIGSNGIGMVLDLASDTSRDGFFTLGDDGAIKAWYPKSRLRHGVQVRDGQGRSLRNWTNLQVASIPLPKTQVPNVSTSPTGFLTISPDTSLIAASMDIGFGAEICVFSLKIPESELLRQVHVPETIAGLGIVDKHLVVLGHHLHVWDLVNDSASFSIALQHQSESEDQFLSTAHLAVDQQNGTFAVVTAGSMNERRSRLTVFKPDDSVPLFSDTLPRTLLAIVPDSIRKGYITVDSESEIRSYVPDKQISSIVTDPSFSDSLSLDATKFVAIGSIFESIQESQENRTSKPINRAQNASDTGHVFENKSADEDSLKVSNVWGDRQAIALPNINVLFAQAAAIISRRAA